MGLNWKGAARGVLGGMKNDYDAQKAMDRKFAQEERLSQTRMNKEKEMYSWKAKENIRAEQDAYDTGVTREEDAYKRDSSRSLEQGTLSGQQDAAALVSKAKAVASEAGAPGSPEYQAAYDQVMGTKKDTTTQALEAASAASAVGHQRMAESYPDLEKGSAKYLRKFNEVMGITKAEKGMSNADKIDLQTEATKSADTRLAAMSEQELLDEYDGDEALARKTLEAEFKAGVISEKVGGDTVTQADIDKVSLATPEQQTAFIAAVEKEEGPKKAKAVKKALDEKAMLKKEGAALGRADQSNQQAPPPPQALQGADPTGGRSFRQGFQEDIGEPVGKAFKWLEDRDNPDVGGA